MKYHQWYLAGLYDLLERGGKQEAIDRIIAEVNNPTQDGLKTFLALGRTCGPCDTCGEPFAIPDPVPSLDEEVLCPNCKKTTSPP
jgi:hypothetical protein